MASEGNPESTPLVTNLDGDDEENGNPTAKRSRKLRSRAWKHFEKLTAKPDEIKAKCLQYPRNKVKLVAYCYSKLYGQDGEQRVSTIIVTLRKLFDEYKERGASTSSGTNSVCGTGGNEANKMVDDGFEDYETFQGMTYGSQFVKSELDLYLEEPCFPMNQEMDVLEYWKGSAMRYPELAKMARDLLAIPVSTVASESTFSTGGRVISPFRSSLKPNTVQALICLQDWMQAHNRAGKLDSSSKVVAETNGSSSSESDPDSDEDEFQEML
ncbi:hypothetical protein RHMOL_Rhmol13G0257500 [Rhododendron molle]|uniref:Uncharacterized protein n=1 Tax=Rhododendron molle TaxID=49168 RepID=A0ACC0LAP3_RHOML|nr:hypothetical protein RHMOL_Rhmol13G0257500 [Rhododendron molle]